MKLAQAHYIIIDDIIDGSETRRGGPCWYKREEVGMNAITDSLLVERDAYFLLKKHFGHLPMYVPSAELMHEATMRTNMGQSLDIMNFEKGRTLLDDFTRRRFRALNEYKTGFALYLPVGFAMYLANKFDPEICREAKEIMCEMGEFYQIQNDYLDCFGDPAKTGKIGQDIEEGKCTWLIVVALEKATPAQKEVLRENYGKADPESVAIVKNLYKELDLPNLYADYEKEIVASVKGRITQTKELPHKLFLNIFDKLYKSYV